VPTWQINRFESEAEVGTDQKGVFVRESTGLVRNISTLDAFFASFSFVAIPLALVTYTTGPFLFPGADLALSTVLTTLLSVPIAVMFTLFGWALPRSGGDYVLNSRILHPVIGFAMNFNMMFWFLFFIGFEANWVSTLAISPSLFIIGSVTSNQSLINLANLFSQPQYALLVGLVCVVAFTLVMLKGVRASFRVTRIAFLVSLAGVAIGIGLLAANTNADFVANFSKFASYSNITATAHNLGYSSSGPNPLLATFGIMPFIYLTTGFAFVTVYYGGEVKSIKKSMLYSQLGVAIVSGLVLTLIAALVVRDFGYDFLGSISFLQSTGASQYPFSTITPYFNLFLSMLTTNQVILWLLGLTYVATFFAIFLPSMMAVSRAIFAWSFDRVIPSRFTNVSNRLAVPVYTILAMSLVWAVSLALYTYGPPSFISLASGATVGENLTLIVVCIAAIIFPFRKRELYASSPAKINVGPVPLISIAGAISLAFILLLQYFLLSNPLYGVLGANQLFIFGTIGVVIALGFAIYIASYYYNKRRGIDITLAFNEIPPD
jgi:basic amino acid/polyamine antiporter, APA family